MSEYPIVLRVIGKDEASGPLSGVGNALSGLGKFALGAVAVGAVAFTGAAAGLAACVSEAMGAQEAFAELQQVIKSTDGVAGVTAQHAADLATNLQGNTRFSDEAIMGAESTLLRFRSINKDIFDEATKGSLDLATAMHIGPEQAALMLGKALVEPGDSLLRLKAAGVNFSDAQLAVIKKLQETGHTAEAQKMILDELNKSIGGAAEAAGNTLAGKLDILHNKFSDIMETIGGPFIPILTQAAGALGNFLSSPEVQAGLQNFAQGIAQGAGKIISFVTGLAPTFQNAFNLLGQLLQGKLDIQTLFAGIFGGGAIGAGGFVQGLISGLMSNFQGLINFVTGTLAPSLSTAFSTIWTAAGPALLQIGGWLTGTLLPALQQLGNIVGPILQQMFSQFATDLVTNVIPALTQLAVWIFTKGLPALGDLAATFSGNLNTEISKFSRFWQGITDNFNKAVKFIADVTTNLQSLAASIQNEIGKAFQWLNDTILTPLNNTFGALVSLAESFLGWLKQIAEMIANMQLPDWLQRHSPSPLEQVLMYSNQHLREMAGLLPSSLGALGGMNAPGLGFAGVGGGGVTNANRAVNFYGDVSIGSESAAREFWRLMDDWEGGIYASARLVG